MECTTVKTYQYTSPQNDVVAVIDADGVSRSSMLASALPEGAEVLSYAPSQAELIAEYTEALTRHLNKTAQSRRYDDRITCMARAGFAGPFQVEATAFAIWADTCNALGYQILDEVLSGQRPMPTVQGFLDLLPPMEWPQ